VTTTSVNNLPRDKNGKWRRQVENAERDARAAELAAQGRSYDAIATELGYADKAAAWRGARKALAEIAASHGLDELYRKQVEENRELRQRIWAIFNDPPPLVSRTGKVVVDEATGEQIPDVQALIGAAATILKAQERLVRLSDVDAPRKSLSMSVDQAAEIIRQDLRAKGYPEPGSPESTAWFRGEAPLRMADGREFPPLTADQIAELDADLGSAMIQARAEE
jgi:hypothetical protein